MTFVSLIAALIVVVAVMGNPAEEGEVGTDPTTESEMGTGPTTAGEDTESFTVRLLEWDHLEQGQPIRTLIKSKGWGLFP